MSFVIVMPDGKYVLKEGGWNHFVEDPRDASSFPTMDAARDARPGHHRDMGGAGFKGYVRSFASEMAAYESRMSSTFRC